MMLQSTTTTIADSIAAPALPLAVDLDGTLLAGDSLHEAVLALLLKRPLALLRAVPLLHQGRAAFKRHIALAAPEVATAVPVRPQVLAWLHEQRDAGRALHLVTGADQAVADAVAERLDLFDSATGSNGTLNLTGPAKARWLAAWRRCRS